MEYVLTPLGDNGIVIEVSQNIDQSSQINVQMISTLLENHKPTWLIEYIPAFTTVTVFYTIESFISDTQTPVELIYKEIQALLLQLEIPPKLKSNVVKIPVIYGGDYGPDLQFVANHNNKTQDEVISIHTANEYTVHMIGFSPGFPFLGGMSEKIATPRKKTPRLIIPARTVGIAGMQTGIYPIETPGGWQLIGRTPLDLFLPENAIPTLLKAGDKIKFYQITKAEYDEFRGDTR